MPSAMPASPMDKSPITAQGSADTSRSSSKQTTQTSAASSAAQSPMPSREPSPTRPSARGSISRASSAHTGTRSRKNSQTDLSPSRTIKAVSNIPTLAPTPRTLNSTAIPALLPTSSEPNINALAPQKSPTTSDQLRDAPRWPVSPRLKSPPPMLNRPNMGASRRGEQDAPAISVQRATPSPQPNTRESESESDFDETIQAGVRTPARGATGSTSTLETVQEVSPLASPKEGIESVLEKMESSLESEPPSQADSVGPSQSDSLELPANKALKNKGSLAGAYESGSESGSIRAERRSGAASAPPPLTSRQSSVAGKSGTVKGKAGEPSLQTMTVETETVASVPQVALAASSTAQGTNGSLRTKPSTETIRPKKEKKKSSTRKQPSVTSSGIGEHTTPSSITSKAPRLRHHQSTRSVSSATDAGTSPPRVACSLQDDATSPRRSRSPGTRSQSMVLYHSVSSLLTRPRPVSSKADIFEAKVASAVEEANSSDSEETFVYDSNPPDGRDRPQRFHSRTPSATSMASQVDRNGAIRPSIHSVLEGAGPSLAKKNIKLVNTYSSTGNDSAPGDEDGNGTGRSNAGSARGTARHHHHFGRWGRSNGNGHPSLFADDSPWPNAARSALRGNNSRQSSGPPSPRLNPSRGATYGKRGLTQSPAYEFDDNTPGADDERTPLLTTSSIRSGRSGRIRRQQMAPYAIEDQQYRQGPSFLNRFASCLVITVMLLLVVSGAIGFMFATSQPLTNIELTNITSIVASEQELMLDMTVAAFNPNVVVVAIDQADIEVFAKSPHAGTDSEWWRKPRKGEAFAAGEGNDTASAVGKSGKDNDDDNSPNMRLGTVKKLDSPLSFEGQFFSKTKSHSTASLRLSRPGNETDHGSERWERILEDEFDLILKGVLRYTLPLSQRVRSVAISGRRKVKPNAANEPTPKPNGTESDVSASV